MKWEGNRESDNVEDRRDGGGGGGGGGLGGLVAVSYTHLTLPTSDLV